MPPGEDSLCCPQVRMSAELLINVTPQETRIALVENGVLQEIYLERGNRRGLVGNVYKGRVSRVLPGMQAAFVDVGLERAAFLHVSDIVSNSASVHRSPEKPMLNCQGSEEDGFPENRLAEQALTDDITLLLIKKRERQK